MTYLKVDFWLFMMNASSGEPIMRMMRPICLRVFSPGNRGALLISSATMQPTAHISTALVY
jgi:hypothetical protein